jgi:phosphoribosylglycinamide formyltransferase-1
MAKLKLGILISGRGSNMQALVKACRHQDYAARVAIVIANRPDAAGLKFAEKAGIATAVVDHKTFADRDSFEDALHKTLKAAKVELVCLAGFMRLLNTRFVNRWHDKLINIHPSLLPAFKGLHTHERVLEAGVRFAGCTVHFVRPEMDDGPIIIQAAIRVLPGDTPERLAARVLKYEHRIYPEAVRLIARGEARAVGNIVRVKEGKKGAAGIINPPVGG